MAWKTIETERLILRSFTLADSDAIHRELYYSGEVWGPRTREQVADDVQLAVLMSHTPWAKRAVMLRDSGTFVGQMRLYPFHNYFYRWKEEPDPLFNPVEVELSFAFGKSFWGQGYAFEASQAMIRYAFDELKLPRLVGGTGGNNLRSLNLHRRLGYQIFEALPVADQLPDDGVVTVLANDSAASILHNPLAPYKLRAYREEDRDALKALGSHVIDWWHAKGPEASLHLIAVIAEAGEIVGHLQVMDAGVPLPSRRPGQCHFTLQVAPQHRLQGIGGALYVQAEAFACRRAARMLYTAYIETEDSPAAQFLKKRGFKPLERFYSSSINLTTFDQTHFEPTVQKVYAQGIQLQTYDEAGDSARNRLQLYELEQLAHASQPFREVEPYIPVAFSMWEQEFLKRDQTTIFLAVAEIDDAWVGVITGLEWYFTGVHPAWRSQGIATALKILCLTEAKKRGIVHMETENHGDNLAMLAINRKLGFVFTSPEAACIKRF